MLTMLPINMIEEDDDDDCFSLDGPIDPELQDFTGDKSILDSIFDQDMTCGYTQLVRQVSLEPDVSQFIPPKTIPSFSEMTTTAHSRIQLKVGATKAPVKLPREVKHTQVNHSSSRRPQSSVQNSWTSKLHLACLNRDVSVDEIESIIRENPRALTQAVIVKRMKRVYKPSRRMTVQQLVSEKYTYPLHLALHSQARPQVITKLIEAAPSVVPVRDGSYQETALVVLIRAGYSASQTLDLARLMLSLDSNLALVLDRHRNTALHAVATYGASLNVVKQVFDVFPMALQCRNFHGKTPLDMARQRTISCSEAVLAFLLRAVDSIREKPLDIDER